MYTESYLMWLSEKQKICKREKRETEGEKGDTKRGGGFPGRHVVLWYGVRVLLDRREVLVSSLPRQSSFPSGHALLHQWSLDPSFQTLPPSSPSLSLLLLPLVPLLLLLFPRPCGCSATSLSELIRAREKREKAPPRGLMHFSLHFLLFSYRKTLMYIVFQACGQVQYSHIIAKEVASLWKSYDSCLCACIAEFPVWCEHLNIPFSPARQTSWSICILIATISYLATGKEPNSSCCVILHTLKQRLHTWKLFSYTLLPPSGYFVNSTFTFHKEVFYTGMFTET